MFILSSFPYYYTFFIFKQNSNFSVRLIRILKNKEDAEEIAQDSFIKGSIVYIDSYGNAITNIPKSLFEEIGKNRAFKIQFRNYEISKLSNQYSEVKSGFNLALFNTTGFLEIAINRGVEGNRGSAAQLLGLALQDSIIIEFEKI